MIIYMNSPLGSEGMLLHNSNSFHILPHFKTQAAPPSYEHAITNNHEIETNIVSVIISL